MKRFIVVAGNIGVGKSTLTAMLSAELGWEPVYEAVGENPYLVDFYQDMRQWGFHSQIFFLARRLQQYQDILQRPGTLVQDRSIYEDAEIFAENLFRQGSMSERDHQTYREMYGAAAAFLPAPDLVIYLRAKVPTLLERIHNRGRDFERSISAEYLEQLNRLYEQWIEAFTLGPVLTVPSDSLDFVKYPWHLRLIETKVMEKLQGKEVVVFE